MTNCSVPGHGDMDGSAERERSAKITASAVPGGRYSQTHISVVMDIPEMEPERNRASLVLLLRGPAWILHPGQGFGHAALGSSKPPQLAPTEMVSAKMTPCRFSPLTSPPSPPFPDSFPSARHLSNAFALHGGVVSFSLSQR